MFVQVRLVHRQKSKEWPETPSPHSHYTQGLVTTLFL